jgi:hypothetical protein
MWGMAGLAAFRLYRLVFEDERSLLVHVACEANRIPRRRRAQLLAHEPTMGIVAIRAFQQPFFHPVMKRHVELRLDVQVTAIAEGWLSLDQQKLILDCLVGRMAAQAAQVVLTMRRAGKVHVALSRAVAVQATLVDLFR